MKSIIRIIAITMFLTGTALLAQAPAAANATPGKVVTPKAPYDSTHAQLAYEKEKNFQFQFAQMQETVKQKTAELQQQYQQQEGFLKSWEASVRAANKWDASYTYDRDTDSWHHAEKPPEKPAEVKPALKK